MGSLSLGWLVLLAALAVALSLSERNPRRTARKRREAPAAPVEGQPICPTCCRPLAGSRHFCQHCLTPLTGYAATGPIESILARGELLRRSVTRPSAIAVIGLWLVACLGIVEAVALLRSGAAAGIVLLSGGSAGVLVVIAVKATSRWRSEKPSARTHHPAEPNHP